ncbi:hypothetical protein NKI04_34705 [Mesorhizobium sp. M0814]
MGHGVAIPHALLARSLRQSCL